jgi:hypothetical protein
LENQLVKYFIIERSSNGINFEQINRVEIQSSEGYTAGYLYSDDINNLHLPAVYYRIRMADVSNKDKFSNVIRVTLPDAGKNSIAISPNPVKDNMQVQIFSATSSPADITIYDETGRRINTIHLSVQPGINVINLNTLSDKPKGIYQITIFMGAKFFSKKIVVAR